MDSTAEAIAAVLVALCTVATLVLGVRNRKTLGTIHVLVNSKMAEALDEIGHLKVALDVARKAPAEDEDDQPLG